MARLNALALLFLLVWAPLGSLAKTITHDFRVSWVTANPDGLAERKIIGINGQWPLPVINVDLGDRLVVTMHNDLGGDTPTSIHWHGMFQNGTNEMDGAVMITQCPVMPGSQITYNFTIEQPGTYWYHTHTNTYPDGYRQALIVHDKDAFFHDRYQEEIVLTMTDWYHQLTENLDRKFFSLFNPSGAEPIPDSILLNDTVRSSVDVKPGTTYLMRLINIGAFVGQYFYIEDHDFEIVEIDGVYTKPTKANMVYLGVAQRYAILLTTKNDTSKNYPIVTVVDSTLLDTIPSTLLLNQTNWLQYDAKAKHPEATISVADSTELLPYDDMKLEPYDEQPLFPEPDVNVNLTVIMANLDDGISYAFFNNITFTAPKVPTLYTAVSSGDSAGNASIYGDNTNTVVLEKDQVVQVVINNADSGAHPFHLHGHNFQLVAREPSYGPGFYDLADATETLYYDPSNHSAFPTIPARRDTFVLPPGGFMVLRFIADNPGVWFFHCHLIFHQRSGLAMVFVEAPKELQEKNIPADHLAVCAAAQMPTKGNAAGNVDDLFDLTGQNVQAGWLPAGFTARGIVALVFSCVSAGLGVLSIIIYGLADLKPSRATADGHESGGDASEGISRADSGSEPVESVGVLSGGGAEKGVRG